MSRVLIVAHHERPESRLLVEGARAWLRDRGHTVVMCAEDALALEQPEFADTTAAALAGCDMCLTFGGDGTILRAVHIVAPERVPVIGVNIGWLGYLTEIEPEQLHDALSRWAAGSQAGDWHIEDRMMLDVDVDVAATGERRRWLALNEGVVERQEPGHTIRLQVDIANSPFTTYAADGLIFATPTGSTAYSFSARGPVLSPRHRAVLVTPVSPHMLFDRALVLTEDEDVRTEVLGHRRAVLTVDGQAVMELAVGDSVTVRPAAASASFVRFGERRFHQILKAKFELPDR